MKIEFELLNLARENAYAPYSGFKVGAAVVGRTKSGASLVTYGCNFENLSFGATICAERNAIGAFVVQGGEVIEAVHVISEGAVSPCGMCLQVIREFGEPDSIQIFRYGLDGSIKEDNLAAFLPLSFVSQAVHRTDTGPEQV